VARAGGSEIALHQFVEALASRDAVGSHVLQCERLLRDLGVESKIYTRTVHPELTGRGFNHEDFRPGKTPTALLYHTAIGGPVADYVCARPEPRIIHHHNITPADMFRVWDPNLAGFLDLGRSQLAALTPDAILGLGDSRFNAGELEQLGARRTAVTPILLDLEDILHEPDEAVLDQLTAARRGGSSWLFVGRLSPNKAQHDIITAFAFYRRTVDPVATLRLVGVSSSVAYEQALVRLISDLDLQDAVTLAGSVPPGTLAAEYRAADALVVLSDHEGFCVPVLEAWHHGLPIVAYAATAVTETVGSAGVLLANKSPAVVAAAVATVLEDADLRSRLVTTGRLRLGEFSLKESRRAFTDAVMPVLDELASR